MILREENCPFLCMGWRWLEEGCTSSHFHIFHDLLLTRSHAQSLGVVVLGVRRELFRNLDLAAPMLVV